MTNPNPPDDFDRSIIDVFNEMLAEGQMTPMVLTFPREVIASIKAYETEHALNRQELLDAALETLQENLAVDGWTMGHSHSRFADRFTLYGAPPARTVSPAKKKLPLLKRRKRSRSG